MRRTLFGYRRADVERALSEAEAEVGRQAELARAQEGRAGHLQETLEHTRRTCIERERRASYLEAELAHIRRQAASQIRGLALLGIELDELVVAARGQATRIRLEALREAARLSERIRALDEASPATADSLTAAIERAIERVALEDGGERAEGEDADATAGADAAGDEPVMVDRRTGELAELEAALLPPAPNGAEPAPDDEGERTLSVDIGPFSDFSQLVSFEDAANAIEATGEISIRRFSEGRASIDISVREPIDLLGELERRFDLDFSVRSRRSDELILDLGE